MARPPARTPGRPRGPAPTRPAAPAPARPAGPASTEDRLALADQALRHALCAAGRRLYDRDLIGAGEGNLSARRGDGTFLVTPSGVSKGALQPGDLLVVDGEGAVISGHGRPSTELAMHLAVYAARPDAAAAVHAHPITAVALTVAGAGWPGHLVPEAAVSLGEVVVAPFAVPGTPEVPASLAPLLPDHDVLLLARHGALCLGGTVAEAVDRMETLERVARMAVLARALGSCRPLAAEQVAAVLRAAGRA
ncbi:MAG: class II aldolase/adducin family protein [Anaeromyxobacter sp.]|nr:class II aldolase/adducin family protein [Anaeromyxobacter sp.]MBL0275480.1 class II aldolase/adducin family protein [Anaeromyxobacter sp.]